MPKKRFREKAEGTFVWTETKTVFWEGIEGIYEQMIVYILLSFWTAGPWRGRRARTVKFGFVLHITHPRFPFRSERVASLLACTLSECEESENVSRPLKTLVHFHSAATVQTLFCWLNLLFFRTTYLSCCTPPALLNLCSFSYLQLHRLDLNAMVVGWDEEIKIYIFIFAWKCCSKLTTAPLVDPLLFLIFVWFDSCIS